MGIFGNDLPAGLRGYVAAQEIADRRGSNALNQGLGILNMGQILRQQALEDQMQPLKLAQLKRADEEAQLMNGILGQYAASRGMPQGGGAPAPLAFGAGGMSLPGGGQANGITGQTAPPPMMGPPAGGVMGGNGLGLPPDVEMMLLHPRLKDLGKIQAEAYKPTPEMRNLSARGVQPGSPQWNAELGTKFTPQGAFSFNDAGGITTDPRFVQSIGDIERAKQGAQAQFDLVDVPVTGGGTQKMSRLDALNLLSRPGGAPAAANPPQTAPQPSLINEDGVPSTRPMGEQQQIRSLLDQERRPAPATGGFGRTASEAERAADKERAITGAKREGDAPDAGARVGALRDNIDRMIGNANTVINSPALGRSVGLFGALPSLPGGKAADMDATIESFKAQISGQVLQSMRDMSKTGGAVGNVTEKEWPRLEGMLGALHTKMSPEAFREAAGSIIKELTISRGRIMDAYNQEYGKTPGAQAPRSRSSILKEYGL